MKKTSVTYEGSVAGGWTENWAVGDPVTVGEGEAAILVGVQARGGIDAVAVSQSQKQQQLWPSSSGCC